MDLGNYTEICENFYDRFRKEYMGFMGDQYFALANYGVTNRAIKLNWADKLRNRDAYLTLKERLGTQDSFMHVLQDNWLRLSLFAGVERLVTVRQTSLFTHHANLIGKDSTTANYNAMRTQGLFSTFRGALLSLIHFVAVPAEAYNLSGNTLGGFISSLLLLETLFYPLDTLRVVHQSNLSRQNAGALRGIGAVKPGQLYSGLPFKLAFSGVFGYYLSKAGSGEGVLGELSNLPWLFLAYPFLTLKSISQVTLNSSNPFSNLAGTVGVAEKFLRPEGLRVLYRGFTPFAAMSLLVPIYMPRLWDQETKDRVLKRLTPDVERDDKRVIRF